MSNSDSLLVEQFRGWIESEDRNYDLGCGYESDEAAYEITGRIVEAYAKELEAGELNYGDLTRSDFELVISPSSCLNWRPATILGKVHASALKQEDKDMVARSFATFFEEHTRIGFCTNPGYPHVTDQSSSDFIRILCEISKLSSSADSSLSVVEEAEKTFGNIQLGGIGDGYLSQVLHAMKPEVFPIINSVSRYGEIVKLNGTFWQKVHRINELRSGYSWWPLNHRAFDVFSYSEPPFRKEALDAIVAQYKRDFEIVRGDIESDEGEGFRWRAIKHVRSSWDPNAPDFLQMFTGTFMNEDVDFLVRGYGKGYGDNPDTLRVMVEFEPETFREMFNDLCDTKDSLVKRIKAFCTSCDAVMLRYKAANESFTGNHLQKARPVSAYAFLLNPDSAFVYRNDDYNKLKDLIEFNGRAKRGEKAQTEYFDLAEKIAGILREDAQLCELSDSKSSDYFDDSCRHALTDELIYYATHYFKGDEADMIVSDSSNSNDGDIGNHDYSLNIILYGPPGTGKTFYTTPYAVAICDEGDVEELAKEYSKDPGKRKMIRERFKTLKQEGRIAFVTFHQSYDYEEFVEGIKPVMDDSSSDDIRYTIESGVFKRICGTNNDFKRAWEQFYEAVAESDEPCTITTLQGKQLKLSTTSKGFKRVSKDGSVHGFFNYEQCLSVYQGERGVEQGGHDNYRKAIIEYLKEHYGLGDYKFDDQPCVIIIDEINRGNISKIFGELITLIEDSKRKGADDETTVTLPYSGDEFSVPSNLYIIGTMNTADRSIALMDTALRRRFDFIEMPPDSSLVKHSVVCDNEKTIDVRKIMETINSRIEALYDREHRIGHTYFMGIEDMPGLEEAFKKKIIPLLQEYFYDDYEKIRLVLADNAADEDFQFIKEEPPESELFFGDGGDYTEGVIYSINEGAFSRPEAYMKIYDRKRLEEV